MDTPASRLKLAREKAGYETAVEAADAMDLRPSTYIGHENGSRGYRVPMAAVYAARFRVTPEWLLYGKGDGPSEGQSERARMIDMIDRIPPSRRGEALALLRVIAGIHE